MKKLVLFLAAAMVLVSSSQAQAINTAIGTISAFDFAPGTALAVGGNFSTGSAVGDTLDFTTLYQAVIGGPGGLGGFSAGDTATLGANDEITVVASFNERATLSLAAPAIATFETLGGATLGSGFNLEIYYNPGGANADNLTGTGYTDGQLILAANTVLAPVIGSFTNFGSTGALDQFGTDNYSSAFGADVDTVIGSGSTSIAFDVEFVDNTFFFETPNEIIISLLFDTTNTTPFDAVNPSLAMFEGTTPVFTPDGDGTFTNGLPSLTPAGSTDFMFEADGNASINVIPEPATMVLAGLGLLGMGFRARRKKA